jgi:hypothetical protein
LWPPLESRTLLWELSQYSGSTPIRPPVILGAKRLDQLQDNLAAEELNLSEDEIRLLDEVSTLPPEYPGWMLAFQDADRLGEAARPVSEYIR